MRRLALIMVLALVAVPAAAWASGTTAGDGVFELKAANGLVDLNGKGVLWGQMDKGSIRVTQDLGAQAATPLVSGAEHQKQVGELSTLYWGSDLHFRVTGGTYHLRFKGSGLDTTVIGVGTAELTGDSTMFTTGSYALDGGKWIAVPLVDKIVPYGVQPPVTTPPVTTPGP